MAKNIFVGSLPFSVSENTVGALFSQYGQVQSINIIKDKYTGQSRGFGFIEMGSDEEAQSAIQALNNHMLEGRNIIVKEALPKPTYTNGRGPQRPERSRGFDRGRGQRRY